MADREFRTSMTRMQLVGLSFLFVISICLSHGRAGLACASEIVAGNYYAVDVSATGVCVNSNNYCDPSKAEGAPDGRFVSLGGEGYIVAELDEPVADGPGSDLRVYEVGNAGNVDAEGFDVYISTNGSGWIKIESCVFNDSGKSYASIDLSGHSGAYGYVKIVDCWTEPWIGSTTGADIVAIQGLYTMVPVEDVTDPVITCPANVSIEAGESDDPSNTGQATATDTNDPSPTVTRSDSRGGSCPEVITRTWTAEDDCGNTATCVQTITVEDTTDPVITCPANVTIEEGDSENPSNTGQATATDSNDPSPTVTYSDSRSGSCPEIITRTWTVEDDCGNTDTCVQTITVEDTTDPVITCPANVTIEEGESDDPSNTGQATATDTNDPSPTVTASDSRSGTCPQVITRTWTAEDECGNTAACVQTITVEDTTDPVITCPANVTIEAGESDDPSNTGQATATDTNDPSPTVTASDSRSGTCPQVITRTWTAEDECGNTATCVQAITVEDTTDPVITCPANVTIEEGDSENPSNTGQATATDSNDPSPTVTYSDSRSGSCPEIITRTWTVEDDCGNTDTCVQTITVENTTDPVITCPANVTIEAGESDDPSNTGQATATDTNDPDPTVTYSDSSAGTCPEVITRTWTAEDVCGNTATCVQTITVGDTTDPVITCPANVTIEAGESEDPSNTGQATATDTSDPDPTVSYSDSRAGSCPEVITRTWTAEDDCGNTATCVQTITIQDTTAPVITCPANVTIEAGESEDPFNTGQATATDTNDPDPTVAYSDVRTGSCPVRIKRTWTAEDDCGNTTSCVQMIISMGGAPPTIASSPAPMARVNYLYLYRASVRDGCRPISFSIVNAPSWTSFNHHNGRLTGTPTQAHIGIYQGIEIRAIDSVGQIGSSGTFSIRVEAEIFTSSSAVHLDLVVRYTNNGFDVEIENSLTNLLAPRMPRNEFFTM